MSDTVPARLTSVSARIDVSTALQMHDRFKYSKALSFEPLKWRTAQIWPLRSAACTVGSMLINDDDGLHPHIYSRTRHVLRGWLPSQVNNDVARSTTTIRQDHAKLATGQEVKFFQQIKPLHAFP